MSGSTIVSPLPVAIGERLQLSTGSTGEAEVKNLLKKHKIQYTAVKTANSDYIITFNAKQQIIITKKKNIGGQISSLQVILPRLTMEGREFRNLDLRFDKPVVTY